MTFVISLAGATIATATDPAPGSGSSSGKFNVGNVSIPAGALPGTYTITANYDGGSSANNDSTGTGSFTIAGVATTTSVSASPSSPSPYGTSVTLTATVAQASGATKPSGTVTFKDGATNLGSATLGSDGKATITLSTLSVASHSITASYTGSGKFTSSTSVALTYSITVISPGLTIGAVSDKVFGSGTVQLTKTTSSSGAVTFGSNTASKCTVTSAGVVTLVSVGTCTVTASQAASGNYAAGNATPVSFEITGASPGLTIGDVSDKVFGSGSVQLTKTSASSGAVSFGSSTPDQCTATAAGVVTLVSVGTCTVTASQVASGNYAAAAATPKSFEITKANQSISFNAPSSKTFGDSPFTLSATGGKSGNEVTFSTNDTDVCTVSGNTLTIVGAGDCRITASQAGNDNYNAASESETIEIKKASQTLSLNLPTFKTFGDAPFEVSATGGATGAATFKSNTTENCTVTGNTVTIKGAGACEIAASQAGNDNYKSATAEGSFEIKKAAQTVAFTDPGTKVYGDAPFSLIAKASSGQGLEFTSKTKAVCSVSKSGQVTILAAGSCTITAATGSDGDDDDGDRDDRKRRGDDDDRDDGDGDDGDGGSNYLPAEADYTFTIGKAKQVISFAQPVDQTYAPSRTVALSATGGGSKNEVTFTSEDAAICTVASAVVTIKSAGSCTITAAQAGNGNYEAAEDVARTFAINKADQAAFEIAASKSPIVYGGTSDISITSAGSGDGTVTYSVEGPCKLDGTTVTATGTGSCGVRATKAGDGNYNSKAAFVEITIGKSEQTITFGAQAGQTYKNGGSFNLNPAASASSELAVSYASDTTDVCTADGTRVTIVSAGTCKITASQGGNENYSAAAFVSQTIAIGNATQDTFAVTTSPSEITYGATTTLTPGAGDGTVSYEVVSGPCKVSESTVTANTTGSGTAVCKITATRKLANFDDATATVEITINPPGIKLDPVADGKAGVAYSQTLSASGGTGPYTYALFEGGALPDGLSLTNGVISGTPTKAGTYTFTIVTQDKNSFTGSREYTVAISTADLTISGVTEKGRAGEPYSQQFTASGGTGPYAFTGATLPPGLRLSGTGLLSGTPQGSGPYEFSVTVEDTSGTKKTQSYRISFAAAAPPPVTISIAPGTLPAGSIQLAYSHTLSASGGSAPYEFSITAGALPAGLMLSPGGVLSGTPTAAGTFNFTVRAVDDNAASATKAFTLSIGTAFVEQRTREVNNSFLSNRAIAVSSQNADRLKGFQAFSNGGGQGVGGGGVPFNFIVAGGESDSPTKFSFGTSLRKVMAAVQANEAKKLEGVDESARMALGSAESKNSTGSSGQKFDLWMEGNLTRFSSDAADVKGDGGLVYVGADYFVTESFLVGAVVQFDRLEERSSKWNSKVEGHGWMAGPYISAKLSEHLFLDARALWGKSENETSPFGTYIDKFDTDRWLARADLTGNWEMGAWRITPSAGLSYFEDEQEAYLDSNGIAIAGQTVSVGQVHFGPEIGYSFTSADGTKIEPVFGIQGIWNFDQDGQAIDGVDTGSDEFRAKVTGGLTLTAPWGYSVRGTASYDGIGSDDYEAVSGQVWVNMPLN